MTSPSLIPKTSRHGLMLLRRRLSFSWWRNAAPRWLFSDLLFSYET